jgi:DNA processing protein
MQISKFSHSDSLFPDSLRQLDRPPKNINVIGTLPKAGDILVAIVGSRRSTNYGDQVTYQLASGLAKSGIVVVSGLARGIDGIAHRAVVEAGGRTIGVLGHGFDHFYPAENRQLARDIVTTGGAVITEYEHDIPPAKYTFPERNRIIAALSSIIIVPEAAAKSASMITVEHGLELNRTIMAVPGNITSAMSAGPNNLLYKGAKPVRSYTDVLESLGYSAREAVPVSAQSPEEAKIIELIGNGQATNDQLISSSGLSPAKFANIISLMEITGKVRNLGAGQWVAR